jgi:hypothetical protein
MMNLTVQSPGIPGLLCLMVHVAHGIIIDSWGGRDSVQAWMAPEASPHFEGRALRKVERPTEEHAGNFSISLGDFLPGASLYTFRIVEMRCVCGTLQQTIALVFAWCMPRIFNYYVDVRQRHFRSQSKTSSVILHEVGLHGRTTIWKMYEKSAN